MVADAGRPEPPLPGGPRRPMAHFESLACGPGRYIAARQPAGGRCPPPPPRLRNRSFSIRPPASPGLGFRRILSCLCRATPAGFHSRARHRMAELVPPNRRGGWRRRQEEAEEVAVGVRGPLPRRQGPVDPLTLGGNNNGVAPTAKSKLQKDVERILELELSGKVDADELLSYLKPVALHQQGDKIDPINDGITSVINDMAMDRRELLQMKLRKMIIEARQREISKALVCRPGQIQEMQGQICELKGRYVRIPPRLVTPVKLSP